MPPKTPDNQPFDFNLDAFVKGMDRQPFRFHWGGKRWELAHIDTLDSWAMIKLAAAGSQDIMGNLQALEVAMGAGQWAEFKKVPLPQAAMIKLVESYFEHCGVEPGESQGSTNS